MAGTEQHRPTRQREGAAPIVYEERVSGALLFGLGLLGLTFGLALILGGLSWIMLLFGLTVGGAGAILMSRGFAGVCTRVEITPDGVSVTAPTWRLAAVPPIQRLAVRWAELRAVRHRQEAYRLLTHLTLPAEVYAIEAERGRIVLGGYYLEELEPILTILVNRAEAAWIDDDPIVLDPVGTLWYGAPAWNNASALEPASR